MKFVFQIYIIVQLILAANNCLAQTAQHLHTFKIKSPKELRDFFKYSPDRIPLMCAHRGGAAKDFPENCIPTFENTLRKMYSFFEVDPRLTKDSVIVLMHDATLNRTTTGKGKVSNYTYEEIQKLYLKDPFGKVSPYKIPTLEEVLVWSKGKTILMIDKKDVPLPMILDLITKHKAESHVLLTVSNPEDAVFYHSKNKDLMFEAFIKNDTHLKNFEATGVPWSHMIAYVSQPKKKEFYKKLHEKGLMVMLYTSPALEKIEDEKERIAKYKIAFGEGCDIVLSDRVDEVYDALQEFIPVKSKKKKYFNNYKLN